MAVTLASGIAHRIGRFVEFGRPSVGDGARFSTICPIRPPIPGPPSNSTAHPRDRPSRDRHLIRPPSPGTAIPRTAQRLPRPYVLRLLRPLILPPPLLSLQLHHLQLQRPYRRADGFFRVAGEVLLLDAEGAAVEGEGFGFVAFAFR